MMAIDLAQRRVNDFRQRCGSYGETALHLAYHAALPVALNAELLHLLRINFFLDPPEPLPPTVEFEFLLSPLCREIDEGLYEIEPDIRDRLLAGLSQTYGTERTKDIASLLWEYVDHHSPWGDRVELERAQQLTALNFLNPQKAQQWLAEVETEVTQGQTAAREWYVAMRQEVGNQTQLSQDKIPEKLQQQLDTDALTIATNQPIAPLNAFVFYSHRDEDFKDKLVVHLANLQRQQKILAWHDLAIEPGAEWDVAIKQQLEAAEIILLLISPRFLASDYCYSLEMQREIERHDAGTVRVIPILLKPVDWQDTPFSKLQALPIADQARAKPITKWDNQDEAFVEVAKGIRQAVESLQAKKSTGEPTATAAIPTPPAISYPVSAVPEPTPSTSAASAAPPAAMSAFRRQRLEMQQAALQGEWQDKMERLTSLRKALAIESSASPRFQLQKEVQDAETALAQLERQLAKIEQILALPPESLRK
jgi:TIR domain